MSDHWLLVLGVSMGAVIILLLVAVLKTSHDKRYEIVELLKECRAYLSASSEMAASARVNRRETAEAVRGLKEKPSREDLARKIEEVPSLTAAEVVKKLPESR